jgi:hypothetical protein
MNGLNGFGLNGLQVNGNITVKDSNFVNITGTEQDDNIQVVLTGINSNIVLDGAGGNDTITTSGSSPNDSEKSEHGDRSPPPDVGPVITDVMIRGGTGDDRLIVDFDQGNPITGAGMSYDGGDGFDAIAIQGGNFTNNIFTAYDPHSGSISFDGSMLYYQNIEPIEDSSNADNITYNGTSGNDSISIVNGTIVIGANTFNAIEIQSPQFENISFANKKNVIIDALAGDDTIVLNLAQRADGLLSFTVRGGGGIDTIRNSTNNILLAGSDLILEAESIIINGGNISGNNISMISTTETGSLNPFADVQNMIDLDDTTITATGCLLLQATSKQLSPKITAGILDIKKTWAVITVTNSNLNATDISLISRADLELLLNSLLLNLPVDPTVLIANNSATTIIDGTSSLISSTGDILIKATSNITTSSVSKSKGNIGSLAFAISVLDNTAKALLQGSATAGAAGKMTIQAESQVEADTMSDGYIAEDASGGGASIAVSVLNNTTKAGIYQNASLLYSGSFDILAYSLNKLDTSAQAASQGSNNPISGVLATQVEGEYLIPESLQTEIIGLFDKTAAGTGEAGGSSPGSGVQVAGAFAFNKINITTEAAVDSTGSSSPAGVAVTSSGLVNIETKALTNDSVLASGMTSSGSTGVGAAFAILIGSNSNQAYVGANNKITAQALNISALTEDFTEADPLLEDTVNDFTVKAYAGQGASNVGISGALTLNIVDSKTNAYLGSNAFIELDGGDLNIKSTNDNSIVSLAKGAATENDEDEAANKFSGGSSGDGNDGEPAVGIGAAIALTIANITTSAYGEDGVSISGANNIALDSDSTSDSQTESDAGAAGGTAAVPVLAFGIILSQGKSGFGKGNKLKLGGNLTANTKNFSNSETKASAVAAGSKVAVGAAVAININNNKALASTARNIEAGGAVTFRAQGAARGHGSAAAGTNGGSPDSDVSDEDPDGADGDESTGGIDEMVNRFMSFMNGMAEDQNIEEEKTEENPDAGSIPETTPQKAETSEGGINVAGAVAINIVSSTIEAFIPSGITITAGGPLSLQANHNTDSAAIADGSAVKPATAETDPKTGVGVAVAINVATTKAFAYIASEATISAGGLNIITGMTKIPGEDDAEGNPTTDKVNTHTVTATSGAGASNVGVAGGVAINVLTTQALAYTDSPVVITAVAGADSDVEISAAAASTGTVTSGAAIDNTGTEAKVGFGASVVVNIISNTVKAYVADGMGLTGAIKNVTLGADLASSTEAKGESGAGSTSATSINGAIVLNVVIGTAEAYFGTGADLITSGDINVTARNINHVSGEASGVAAGSKVGVGIALAINVVTDKTLATTRRNINAAGAVSFKAEGASGSSTTAKAGTNGGKPAEEGTDPSTTPEGEDSGVDKEVNKQLSFLNKTSEEKGIEKDATEEDKGSIPETTPQSAETSEGGVNVAGALALNIVSSTIEAYIPTGITITAGGPLSLQANHNTDSAAIADGSAVDPAETETGAKIGVGVAVAINVATTKALAYIATGAMVSAGGLSIVVGMTELPATEAGGETDKVNTHTVTATSGAGASNVGVAGGVAINVLKTEALAYVNGPVTITAGDTGDVIITAKSASQGTVSAGAAISNSGDAAKVGFGASVAVNIISTNVKAYVADGITLSGAINNVALQAELESKTETKAESGASSSSATSINGAVALAVVNNTAEASFGTSVVTLTATGDVSLIAANSNSVITTASGVAAGSKVGIGIALALNVINDKTIATTNRNINASGAVTFAAHGTTNGSAASEAGTNGGEEEETPAEGEEETTDDGGADGDTSTSGVDEKANSQLGFLNKTSEKQGIEKDATAGDEGNIPEKTPQNAETSEGGINVAAAVSLNIVNVTNKAYIPTGITITAGGKLKLEASGNTDAAAKSDGSAVKAGDSEDAKVGVGAAVAINVVNTKTQAFIASGAVVTAGGLYIGAIMTEVPAEEAGSDPDKSNKFSAEAVSGAGSGKVGIAGSVALNVVNSEALAYTASSVTIVPVAGAADSGNVTITAASTYESSSTSGASVKMEGEEAKVGIGASFASNIINTKVLAYIANNMSLTGATDLTITSNLSSKADTTATAGADPIEDMTSSDSGSQAKIGLDAAVALTIINNENRAYIGSGCNITATGNVQIKANGTSTTSTTAQGNSSGSKVAVGAAVGVNVINATTEAALKGNATIGGSLTVEAKTVNRDDVFTLATARGLNVERYMNKFKKTSDQVLSGDFGNDSGSSNKKPASAKALEDNNVQTAQTSDQNGGTTGENSQGSQKICIAAAVGVNVTTHNTFASTVGGAVTVGGDINVNATSTSDFEVLGTGAAVGDGNSIGVGVAVSVIHNDTSASQGSANAGGHNITVKAVATQNMSDEFRSKLGAQAIAGAGTGKD